MTTAVSGASPQTRIQELDIIRGFALFGVFAVNLSYSLVPPSGPTDRAIAWIVNYLFQDRFWPLFTFLFGLSFTILLTRAESRGHNTLVIYLRRMAVLFLFGALLHTFLAGGGRVLVRYAAIGLLLVPLRRVRSSVLIAFSAGLFLLTAARVQDFVRARWTPEQRAVEKQRSAENRRIRTTGTFAEVTLNRGEELWHTVSHSSFLFGATSAMAAVFLLGLAFAHTSVLGNLATHQDFLRRAFFWCLLAGVTGVLLSNLVKPGPSWPYPWRTAWIFFDLVSAALQGLSYAAGLAVVLRRPLWRQRLGFLAPAGRMTLTNFFLQALLIQILFDRFFLQLKLGPAAGFVLTMGLFALQVAFSKWRLREHRYGPLEQLWRYLTYGSARYREHVAAAP